MTIHSNKESLFFHKAAIIVNQFVSNKVNKNQTTALDIFSDVLKFLGSFIKFSETRAEITFPAVSFYNHPKIYAGLNTVGL